MHENKRHKIHLFLYSDAQRIDRLPIDESRYRKGESIIAK